MIQRYNKTTIQQYIITTIQQQLILIIMQNCLDSDNLLQTFCDGSLKNSSDNHVYHIDVGYVVEGLVVAMLACSSWGEPTTYKTLFVE